MKKKLQKRVEIANFTKARRDEIHFIIVIIILAKT